jgi:aminoglycoside 6'-N-acetyltransferase I
MIIRPAAKNDRSEWSRLRTLLWPDTQDNHLREIDEYFDGASHDIVEVLVVDCDNEKLAGFIELNIRNFAEGSRQAKVAYVEGWYVDEAYRNRGIGSRLMKAAEQWAFKQGYFELASDTEIDNQYSIELHKKLGFKETDRVVCFLKKLK